MDPSESDSFTEFTFAEKVSNICQKHWRRFQLLGPRRQLVEIIDLECIPTWFKNCLQNTLTAQWTHRLPLLQQQSPAELAASVLAETFNSPFMERDNWTVIDLCSGSGGPVPSIEKHINARRNAESQPAIPFRLSDLAPNIPAWTPLAAASENLDFIPQAVNARDAHFGTLVADSEPSQSDAGTDRKVFALHCLSFHHFDDDAAAAAMTSTLEHSDAFAIIELQDRSVASLLLLLLEPLLLVLATAFWFPNDATQLLLTYGVPVLPAVHLFDGVVSCLRTRTLEELVGIVRLGQRGRGWRKPGFARMRDRFTCGDWTFEVRRRRHTRPVGVMTAFGGRRTRRVVGGQLRGKEEEG